MAEQKLIIDPEPVFKNSNWGLTKFDVMVFSYRWDIQQFWSLSRMNGGCCEMNIPTDGRSATQWYLRVYPNGKDAKECNSVGVYLYCLNQNRSFLKARYSLELRDGSDNLIISRTWCYTTLYYKCEYGLPGYNRDILLKQLENSSNRTLVIICTIWELTDAISESGSFGVPNQKAKDAHSTNLLKTLLTEKAYSDFTIYVKERQFKVHKAVLHACSPVFATMLSTEMKERLKNEATLDDVEPDIFEKIVEFMYTGNVTTINVDAMVLVPVAHKYDLKGLLEQCEAVLCPQISMDKAVRFFIFSNVYSLEFLRSATMQYIKANLNEVSQTADWKSNVENDPNFLTLLFVG